jgi:iron complex transport system ATP-binding protein
MKELLVVDRISCGYGDQFNLQEISFTLREGSFTGILGPNGSGKSTLFKGISGDLKLNRGTIRLDGREFSSLTLQERAQNLAIVTQFPDLSNITVEEYVLMGRIPYRKPFQFFDKAEDREIALHYMEMTEIIHLRHKRITALSGGELQMVSIACALTQKPRLLLLDEPTSHLDITHQVRFMNLLQKLNEELKLTVAMIVHDLNLASEYCDHLILMEKGRIYQQGAPEEVLNFENIERVYDTVVLVNISPITQKPVIFPVSQRRLKATEQDQ